MITVSEPAKLLVNVALIAGDGPKLICFRSVLLVNVNPVGIGGTWSTVVITFGVAWLSTAVTFTALDAVEESSTENVQPAFAEPIPTVVGVAPAFQLTLYWMLLTISPKIPFVALTVPDIVTGTPEVTDVGIVEVTVNVGLADTTVTLLLPDIVPDGPDADAPRVTTVPTELGAVNRTAVEEPKFAAATSSPFSGMFATGVLRVPEDAVNVTCVTPDTVTGLPNESAAAASRKSVLDGMILVVRPYVFFAVVAEPPYGITAEGDAPTTEVSPVPEAKYDVTTNVAIVPALVDIVPVVGFTVELIKNGPGLSAGNVSMNTTCFAVKVVELVEAVALVGAVTTHVAIPVLAAMEIVVLPSVKVAPPVPVTVAVVLVAVEVSVE